MRMEGLTGIKVPCMHVQNGMRPTFPQLICINKTARIIYKMLGEKKKRQGKFKVHRTIKLVGLDTENVIHKGKKLKHNLIKIKKNDHERCFRRG